MEINHLKQKQMVIPIEGESDKEIEKNAKDFELLFSRTISFEKVMSRQEAIDYLQFLKDNGFSKEFCKEMNDEFILCYDTESGV